MEDLTLHASADYIDCFSQNWLLFECIQPEVIIIPKLNIFSAAFPQSFGTLFDSLSFLSDNTHEEQIFLTVLLFIDEEKYPLDIWLIFQSIKVKVKLREYLKLFAQILFF